MHARQVQSSPAKAPRYPQAQQGWAQPDHRQLSPQPFHCEMKRHVLPDGQLFGQAFAENLSFSSHPTRGRENNGGKGAELNLSHSLAILSFLFPLKALLQGWHCCRQIAWAVRVKYPDIDERVVPRVGPQPFCQDVRAIPVGNACGAHCQWLGRQWLWLRLHLHVLTNLAQTVGCEIAYLVPIEGEAANLARNSMVDREGTTTCTTIR